MTEHAIDWHIARLTLKRPPANALNAEGLQMPRKSAPPLP